MAKMKRPIGDLVSGKIGNVVFFRPNLEAFVKAAPLRKTNTWTADQQMHRQRFSIRGVYVLRFEKMRS